MKRKNIIIIIGIIILIAALSILGVCIYKGNEEKVNISKETDALKFKKEYEALNGTIREGTEDKYNSVTISEDNPIKYIDTKEAISVLEKDQAILYVGAEWCPWCRNAVPVLFEVANTYKVDTIYYLNLDDEKSVYEVKDNKAVMTKEGTEDYYKLLDALDEELSLYTLTDENGKVLETNEKRIYMPFVVAIKDGKVVGTHTGTTELNKDQTKYDKLTDKQHAELVDTYGNLFKNVYGEIKNTCDETKCD